MEESKNSVITLNVGGKKFSTTTKTLSQIPNSFFSRLIAEQIQCLKDDSGTIFIDRDPVLFEIILNFLRSGDVDLRKVSIGFLKDEAKFYGITPLVKQLTACLELRQANCGSLLFCTRLKPLGVVNKQQQQQQRQEAGQGRRGHMHLQLYSPQVTQIVGHHNCVAVVYSHCICVLKARECQGWELVFVTPTLAAKPELVALNGCIIGARASSCLGNELLASSTGSAVSVWSCSPQPKLLTTFDMAIEINGLSFANNQLVVISNTGKVAIWQSVRKHWQRISLSPIGCYIVDGSFLFFGCEKGSIDSIDAEKFPVRLKDKDLLVNQVFDDPHNEAITAVSIYRPTDCGGHDQSCIEIAYGTKGGRVKLTRYPQTLKHSSRLFQSYHVHAKPVASVALGQKYLVSVCRDNHVRTWSINRINDHIPSDNVTAAADIISISSFRILSLDGARGFTFPTNSIGPFSGREDEFGVFVQRVVPSIDTVYIRQSSTGHRVCKITSVDQSHISCYYVHDELSPSHLQTSCSTNQQQQHSKQMIFTGHDNGSLQIWDLNAAFENHKNNAIAQPTEEGLTEDELLHIFKTYRMNDISNSISSANFQAFFKSSIPPCPVLLSALYPDYKQPERVVPKYCKDTPLFAADTVFTFPSMDSVMRPNPTLLGEKSLTPPAFPTQRKYKGVHVRQKQRFKSTSDIRESDYDTILEYPLRKIGSETAVIEYPLPKPTLLKEHISLQTYS